MNVPEITYCVRVDWDLHVKFFYKGSPLLLPQWFRHGRDCRLTRKSMMQNFLHYITLERKQMFSILEELKELKFEKKEYSCPILFNIHFIYVILPYKHTNGSHFVVGLKDTVCSKKVWKLSLLKKDIDINGEIKISCPREME